MRGIRHKTQVFLATFLTFSFLLLTFLGCATIKESAKCVAGVSTKVLEEGRDKAIIKMFNMDYNACYAKVEKILLERGSYIYAKNKEMIAIYVSWDDTTPVGVFFKEVDPQHTQIEVTSPSTFAKEKIANIIFSALENKDAEKTEVGDK